jgi:UDP-3-O-[3-hydroxymyristoyl] glucosamine N-acyltransferase
LKLRDIARTINANLKGDPDLEIAGVAPLESGGPDQICLYLGGKYKKDLARTGSRALVVAPGMLAEGFSLLEIERPRLRYIEVIRLFHVEERRIGIHPRAVVSPTASLGEGVFIGANAFIGDGVRVGDGTEIHENTVIYGAAAVGRRCRIWASVVIREGTVIGDNVIIHPGAVLGADGFGFEPDEKGVYRKIPQVGRVVIEDDVEIGANTCIDRAALGETRIGRGVKIDNLCQFGHNVRVGPDTVISGMVGISGSVNVGRRVVMGGGCAVADHVNIGDGVMMAGRTGVLGDVPPGSVIGGAPHTDLKTFMKAMAILYRQARKGHTAGEGR